MQGHKSLLAIGVLAVEGEFERGDVVACVDEHGLELGRGLINYSASDTRRIMRQPSTRLADFLGSTWDTELKIGSASCREREGAYGENSRGVGVSKKNKYQ